MSSDVKEPGAFRGIVTAKPVRAALTVRVTAKKKTSVVEEHGNLSFECALRNCRAFGAGKISSPASGPLAYTNKPTEALFPTS